MKTVKLLILFILISVASTAQNSDSNIYVSTIKKQAQQMGDLLVNRNYKGFSKFTYPRVMDMMGGKKEMVKMLDETGKKMEEQGYTFLSVNFGEPDAKVIKFNGELQCLIPQTITMKAPGGKMIGRSALIAISSDNGKNWYFIDTSSNDLETMRNMLPNLSPDLIIPPKQNPEFQKD